MSRRSVVAFFAMLAMWSAVPAVAAGACSPTSLEIRGDWGQVRFNVEVADTDRARAIGLMHRETLPRSAGMLFVYEDTGPVSFWMRNTLIPLDMLFVDQSGVIRHIHHNAVPLDETPIPGGDAVRYVLEINGGLAGALGISVGSEMRHPAMVQEIANWRC